MRTHRGPSRGAILLAALAVLPWAAPCAAQRRVVAYRSAVVRLERAVFRGGVQPWSQLSAELGARGRGGALLARVSVAERFERTGHQFEVDAYPILGQSVYAYINAGYSPSGVFPESRVGAELYWSVVPGWELSLGGRRLNFPQTRVTIATASLGRYLGNYLLTVRPYVRPERNRGTSASVLGSARRYFRTADEYVTILVGGGSALSEQVSEQELDRVRSVQVGIDGTRPLRGRLHLAGSADVLRETLPAQEARTRFTLGAALQLRF